VRIAICNVQMSARTGTEIVTRDFALGLRRRGHDVHVVTGYRGALCDELDAAGIHVELEMSSVPRPDVFHVNHMPFARPLLERYPDVPALVMCHDSSGTNSAMWPTSQVRAWSGVSQVCCDRAAAEAGISPGDVLLLPNAVDLDRLPPPRSGLPWFPRRWLYVGEKQFGEKLEEKLRRAARRLFASVDVVGPFTSQPRIVDNLPAFARDYDLVVASARCAMECAAAGTGVVVGDPRGIAGFLGPAQWDDWQHHNFGFGCLTHQPSSAVFAKAALRWNRGDIAEVAAIARKQRDLSSLLDRLEAIYTSCQGPKS
jgi:hypothetical protein